MSRATESHVRRRREGLLFFFASFFFLPAACGNEAAKPANDATSGTGGAASGSGGSVSGNAGQGGTGGTAAAMPGGSPTGGTSGAMTGTGGAAGTGGDGAAGGGMAGTSGGSGATGGQGAVGGSASGSGGGGSGAAGGGNAGTGGGASSCSGTSTLAKGDSNRTVQVGSTSRTYILHVPTNYTGMTPVALVLDFHGLGGTGSSQRSGSGFGALSDRDGFVIAWPNGIDNAWNVGPCCTRSREVDDVGFAKAIVTDIKNAGCIDTRRVYATGFSMGGGMSHYLACHAADVFAAAAPHAFDLLEENQGTCNPSRPISILSFRGTNDTLVPYAGGESNPPNGCCPPIHFLGAEATLTRWAALDGCTGSATTSGNTRLHTQCMGGAEVGLYTIQGGGHAAGPVAAAWDFLKAKSLP